MKNLEDNLKELGECFIDILNSVDKSYEKYREIFEKVRELEEENRQLKGMLDKV